MSPSEQRNEYIIFITHFNLSCPCGYCRKDLPHLRSVGLPGIEPGLQDPQPCVLPLYYSPVSGCLKVKSSVGVPGIEPGLHEPESCVLPVYYTPTQDSIFRALCTL